MLQNKIYQNYFKEIFKTFFVILLGLSLIALTVRAVSFLDLIVENGYSISNYFKYSVLNLSGIAPKFFPLSFLIALTIFITKHLQDSEFLILWTSGVKKIQIVNLFFYISMIILIVHLTLTIIITPYFLNKSRILMSSDNANSLLPTIKRDQFSDTFKKFTFFVQNKNDNEIENIFLFDEGNKLKSLSSNDLNKSNTTILAKKGLVNDKKLLLFNGQIITSKKDNTENEIIKFEQINIDLGELNTTTIKQPKLQETSTLKFMECVFFNTFGDQICDKKLKEEIISVLNRRIFLPFYIPALALICSLQLIKSQKNYLNKYFVFLYCFLLVLFSEMAVRLTGVNYFIRYIFIILPFILSILFYIYLVFRFSKEARSK